MTKTRKHRQQRSRRRTGGSGRPVRAVRVKAAAAAAAAAEAKVHPAIKRLDAAYKEAGEHLKTAKEAVRRLKERR